MGYMKEPPKASAGSGQPIVVDDAVERLLHLPQLLHAQREDLWDWPRLHPLPVEPGLRQRAARPLGQDRDLGPSGPSPASRRLRSARPSRSSPDGVVRTPITFAPLHEQRVHREAGEDVDAETLGLLAQPPHDVADRRDVVPMVLHRGRRRDPHGFARARQDVDALLRPPVGGTGSRSGRAPGRAPGSHSGSRPHPTGCARRAARPSPGRRSRRPRCRTPASLSFWTSLASSMAPDSPAGPPPTKIDVHRDGLVVRRILDDEALARQSRPARPTGGRRLFRLRALGHGRLPVVPVVCESGSAAARQTCIVSAHRPPGRAQHRQLACDALPWLPRPTRREAARMSEHRPTTLGELKAAGYETRTSKTSCGPTSSASSKSGEELFEGIRGYSDTVTPQIVNALLAKHDFILLGLRGQAKSRILRQLVSLLDEVTSRFWRAARSTTIRSVPYRSTVDSSSSRRATRHRSSGCTGTNATWRSSPRPT